MMAQPSPQQQVSDDEHNISFDDHPRTPVSPIASQSAFTTPPSARRPSKHASTLSLNGEELIRPAMSRPESAASDRVSVTSGLTQHFPNSPLNVNPQPAYVAPAGAAQVANEHRSAVTGASISDDEDDRPPSAKDEISFAEPALALINQFLDQLLYSFLSAARSTSMVALRPAVTEVLKQRLAKEAIASAEEELAELLAGGDDEEEMDTRHKAAESDRNWDLELVWKRTRLRVMVYIRLGEMEDDDEQRYVREEELFQGSERRFSSTTGLVSWAAAIFLTSVLEYVAEQTVQVAGGAAHARVRRQARSGGVSSEAASNVVVEEHDVEKVALNSTLGRLWRTWRKSLRNHANGGVATPTAGSGLFTPSSRENMYTAMSHRRGSSGIDPGESVADASARPSTAASTDRNDESPELQYPEHVLAANIPLPVGNGQRDVHEIEVPGLAADPDIDDLLSEILLSDLAAAAHTPVPTSQRDTHEIEVPGLARDTDDDDDSQSRHAERMFATGLPLPMQDEQRDVDEIEVPGLAADPDAQAEPISTPSKRRNSFTSSAFPMPGGLPTAESSQPVSPVKGRRGMTRRSSSVPTPARTPLAQDEDKIPAVPTTDTIQEKAGKTAEDNADTLQRKESERSSVHSQAEEDKNQSTGIVAGVAAGAVAAGTAVAAAVFGSKENSYTDEPDEDKVASPPEDGLPKSNKTAAEIEELDKRKSLIDIKAIAGLHATPRAASGRQTPEAVVGKRVTAGETTAPPIDSLAGPGEKGRESMESYTLGDQQLSQSAEEREEISSEEGPQDAEAIGVAQTSDVASASPGMPGPNGMEQDAREKHRPSRILIGNGQPDSPTTKQMRNSADATGNRPRSFSRKSEVSLTDQNRYVAQQIAQGRGIPQSPTTPRQRHSASFENGSSSPLSKQGQQVQEHPVIQRMASLKRNNPVIDDQGNSLTSASIRGPEDFDMFVQGGETVKYTLTPEAVRNDLEKQMPEETQAGAEREIVSSPVTSNAEALKLLEAASPRDSREGRSKAARPSRSAEEGEEARKRQHRRSISRPPTTNTKSHSKSGMMAREPRVQTESTRDFADFIRSTGPDKENSVYPLMNNVSTTSLNSLRSAHINGASASRSSSPSASRSHSLKNGAGGEAVPPVPPIPSATRGNMQPRGASGASPGNSDLIDFIRSGPDQPDKHRISRSVAPFRNTMDSDQFRDTDGSGNDQKANPSLNTYPSQSMRSSQRTSVNSRSALINGTGNTTTAHPAYSGKPQTLSSPQQSSEPSRIPSVLESEPTKKRYRNKDPYAIDFSDDEDDDLVTALPRSGGGARKEESLMDFLNSMEPPKDSGSNLQPLIDPNSAMGKKLIENAKANGLHSSTSTRPLASTGASRSLQSNLGPRSNYASSVNSARSNGSRPQQQYGATSITSSNAPRAKMVARSATEGRQQGSSTNDLASFLRDSGPPEEDPESAPAPIVGRGKRGSLADGAGGVVKKERKGSAFSGLFGRGRKKQAYLDVA